MGPVDEGHSTCTASKAFGTMCGASKKTSFTVVKMPDYTEDSLSGIFNRIGRDIRSLGRQGRSIINVSWASEDVINIQPLSKIWQEMFDTCKTLNDLGVFIVAAAGNDALTPDAQRDYIDTAPAIYGYQLPYIIPVGSSNTFGERSSFSQRVNSSLVPSGTQVYAPGENIECADSMSTSGIRVKSGTSFCKPA